MNEKELLNRLFGNKKSGCLAVFEISCSFNEKVDQCRRNTKELRKLINDYVSSRLPIYKGIGFWNNNASGDEILNVVNLDFVIKYESVPEDILKIMKRMHKTKLEQKQFDILTKGLFRRKREESISEMIERYITDDRPSSNILGISDYGRKRGQLAELVGKALFRHYSPKMGVMKFEYFPRKVEISGSKYEIGSAGEIDALISFPHPKILHQTLVNLGHNGFAKVSFSDRLKNYRTSRLLP